MKSPEWRGRNVTQQVHSLRHHLARMSRRITLLLMVCVSLAIPAAARRRAVRVPELYPPCSMITGTAAVTFTFDEGRTLTPSAEPLTPIAYTYGLAAMDAPDTLIAWHR